MSKENLPLSLFEKHRATLETAGMASDAAFFESDADLFTKHDEPIKSAVVFLPKSRALINMTLALVSGMVEKGGAIILTGTNDAGIRSAKDSYEKYVGPVSEKIVGNHSALWVGTNERRGEGKTPEDFLSFFPLKHGEIEAIQIAALPGVFSLGALDGGTKLLLDHIPFDKKSVLDVGCGAGVIGALYKKKNPSSAVTMSDKSQLAVIASRKTLAQNNLAADVVRSDVFDGIGADKKFDLVLCNPPFHTGINTDYSFIDTFAAGARARLNKGGEVWIVANAFLPYQPKLEQHIGATEIVADNGKFRVYRSRVA